MRDNLWWTYKTKHSFRAFRVQTAVQSTVVMIPHFNDHIVLHCLLDGDRKSRPWMFEVSAYLALVSDSETKLWVVLSFTIFHSPANKQCAHWRGGWWIATRYYLYQKRLIRRKVHPIRNFHSVDTYNTQISNSIRCSWQLARKCSHWTLIDIPTTMCLHTSKFEETIVAKQHSAKNLTNFRPYPFPGTLEEVA